MEYETESLDGAELALAFAVACGPHHKPPRIRDGVCEVYDNPCGFPGPCFDWFPFLSEELGSCKKESDIGGVYLRHHLQWYSGTTEDLKSRVRAYVLERLGPRFTS